MDLNRLEHKMSRFRPRRKAKDQQQAESHSDHGLPMGLSFTSKNSSKNKRPATDHRSSVDLSIALPASDDFRTSLLMPNLSARFSMLREQDDPSTKIGKANDDSVLFPKRASRLNLFSHNPLTDLAEVDSLRDSIRPPFVSRERAQSTDVDSYESDGDGTIMARARPGEGNNLFGGRQKLYRIPAESLSRTQTDSRLYEQSSSAMNGRPMYENDVSLSLFQKHRLKEREHLRSQAGRESLDGSEDASLRSPTISLRRSRETASSTMSAPQRDSTAATSIASIPISPKQQHHQLQHNNISNNGHSPALASPKSTTGFKPGFDRVAMMYRKLYGQAASPTTTPQLDMQDGVQDLNRPLVGGSENASPQQQHDNSSGHNQTSYGLETSPPNPNFPSTSPPPSASSSGNLRLDGMMDDRKPSETAKHNMHGGARPLSPPAAEGEDTAVFSESIQPEDRGKATAMGLFNKPHRNYDEQQFSSRQLQMHQGRDLPSSTQPSTPRLSSTSLHEEKLSPGEANDRKEGNLEEDGETSIQASRPTNSTNGESDGLEIEEAASGNDDDIVRNDRDDTTLNSDLVDGSKQPRSERLEASTLKPLTGSPEDMHPALRPSLQEFQFPAPADNRGSPSSVGDTRRDTPRDELYGQNGMEDDDELKAPSAGPGLSGLVRAHLRVDSDKSSFYPSPSPRASVQAAKESRDVTSSPVMERGFDGSNPASVPQVLNQTTQDANHSLATANTTEGSSEDLASRSKGEAEAERKQNLGTLQGPQDESQSKHQRDASTETQQERQAFNQELAERRRRVQEKLKSVVETGSRSTSPTPSMESGIAKPGHGFSAMLRGKSSRPKPSAPPATSPVPPQSPSQPAKAMKFFGLHETTSPGTPSPARSEEELWREEEEKMVQSFARRPRPKDGAGFSPTKGFPRPRPGPSSSKGAQHNEGDRLGQRSVTLDSNLAGRSKGRHGQYRNDVEKAMVEGSHSHARPHALPSASNFAVAESASGAPKDQPPRSATAMSGRYRSNSRASTPVFYESKAQQNAGLPPLSPNSYSPAVAHPGFPASQANGSSASIKPRMLAENSPGLDLTDGRTASSLRGRKRSITKNMISDPTFISTTYAVGTVDLPPGAPLHNGKTGGPPAVPMMNPRRRGRVGSGAGTTQTMFPNLVTRTAEANAGSSASSPSAVASGTVTGQGSHRPRNRDGDEIRPAPLKPRPRLRKISSEGGDLNNKARYQALMSTPSPMLPTFPVVAKGLPPTALKAEGEMF